MTHKHTPAPINIYKRISISEQVSYDNETWCNTGGYAVIPVIDENKPFSLTTAAPELLKALEIAQRYVPKISGSGYIIIKEAIKKARGE